MAHLVKLVAGLLMIAGAHESDVADRSMHQGFLSQYMGSDASKTSLDDYNKFVTARLNHMKHGGAPDALSHHNGPAEHGPTIVFDKSARAVQQVVANDNSMSIGMSAIGVSLLTLAAMLGVRMRRGLQQEADMSIALAPAAAGNILEMKSEESIVRGHVGWSQESSKNSRPLTLCYAGATDVPAKDFYALTAKDIDGKDFSFSELKGATEVVINNVASECGLTNAHYADYASLKKKADSLRIVAFPCNQFGAQEPGTPEEIKSFVQGKGLTVNTPESHFKLMGKVDVNGADEHPVFTFLKKHSDDADIGWNFVTKFIVKCTEDDMVSISRVEYKGLRDYI